jgi:hypothetical protein
MVGQVFATMKPFAPPPPPGAQPPPLWGSEDHVRALFGDRVEWRTLNRDIVEITAFSDPHDYARHFTSYYGPTIAARANAGREAEFDEALIRFCDDWNRGEPDRARFGREHLLASAPGADPPATRPTTAARAHITGRAGSARCPASPPRDGASSSSAAGVVRPRRTGRSRRDRGGRET